MTEPLDVLVQAALYAQFQTPELTSPVTPRAAPLLAYTPVTGVKYYAVHPIMRAEPDHAGMRGTDSTIFRGIFQVDAVTPDNIGEAPGLRLAALVAARFPMGTKLTAGTYLVKIYQPPFIAAAVKDAPWVRFPCSIPFLVIA